MSARTDYLKKKIEEMSEDERTDLLADLLSAPSDEVSQIELSLMADFTDSATEKFKNFGKMQGLSTGYPKLDKMTKGLVGGELIVLAGLTSHGKTTLAINIANKVALQGHSALFVTLEMTQDEITSRYMEINGGPDSDDYLTVSSLTTLQVTNNLNWRSIDALIEKAVLEMRVSLVVIDHLHYFTRELENIAEDLGRITKELKKNAIKYKIPIILISHVRRLAKTGTQATIDDLRGSSYIAQDSDIVLMINRARNDPKCAIVKIEKNRNRGFDYDNDEARLYLEGIKIYNSDTDAIFANKKEPSPSEQLEGETQPLF